MAKNRIFDDILEDDVKKLLNCFNAVTLHFKKEAIILSNVSKTTQIGIILSGNAQIIRYNANGSRTLIETLKEGNIFGDFSAYNFEELYIIATTESDIIMFEYDKLITRCRKNCPYHNKLIDNTLKILSDKLRSKNERIEILSKKTIREKLLAYFNMLAKKQITRNINLPFSYTDLADYLSIDRSAMMRELKNLKDEDIIETKEKKIYLKF